MVIHEGSDLREIAFTVCTALDRTGTRAVLSGGGAATIWAPRSIRSGDLDFILQWTGQPGNAEAVLAELGFTRAPKAAEYRHARTRFFLEFPPGPLAIGDDILDAWETLENGEERLHLLTPTDSCRDRLAAFLHWNDRNALQQALAVAVAQRDRIDLETIRRWCLREGHAGRFEEFARAFGNR